MRGLWLRHFLAVGVERDIQDCRHKGRLFIAILYNDDGSLAISATELFASRRRADWRISQYISELLCSVRLFDVLYNEHHSHIPVRPATFPYLICTVAGMYESQRWRANMASSPLEAIPPRYFLLF
jgi:hypothetical protein